MPDPTEPEDIHDDSPEGGDAPKSLIDQRKLAEEAARRRKELPLLQRIVKHFSKDRAVYRELVINAETLEKRVALLTNGVLDKFEIEHRGENRMVGAILGEVLDDALEQRELLAPARGLLRQLALVDEGVRGVAALGDFVVDVFGFGVVGHRVRRLSRLPEDLRLRRRRPNAGGRSGLIQGAGSS